MGDTWQSEEAWIAIGWPQIFAIGRTIAITRSSSGGRNRSRFLETRGVFWCVRSQSRGRLIFIETIMIGKLAEGSNLDRGARDRCIVIVHLTGVIGRQRSFLEERRDRGAIELRSHHDRIAIERRLHSFGAKSEDQIVTIHQAVIGGTSTVRSTPDRDAIVARSWPDRPAIGSDLPRN